MRAIPGRFYSLDVLRGIAAIAVVCWHWQHFFVQPSAGGFVKTAQPFYRFLFLFYDSGFLAVNFFFSLSGFIFFWLYSEKVKEGAVSALEFSFLRFSRLYPLHFATLAAVALMQAVMVEWNGEYFVYRLNNLRHFAFNLFLISDLCPQSCRSFNGPIWSVSREVFLYCVFFMVCRLGAKRAPVLLSSAALAAAGGYLMLDYPMSHAGRGLLSFFIGGMTCKLYLRLVAGDRIEAAGRPLSVACAGLWLIAVLNGSSGARTMYDYLSLGYFTSLVLFPLTVLTLAVAETRRGTLGRRLAFLGNISYSSYLLHFPLQLAAALAAGMAGLPRTIFYSPYVFCLFFAVLIGISLASYHFYERPVQDYLRKAFENGRNARRFRPLKPGAIPDAAGE